MVKRITPRWRKTGPHQPPLPYLRKISIQAVMEVV
jgi:hypothetical protein